VLLSRVGLPGPGWAAALCIGAGATAAPSVLASLRRVEGGAAGEALTRRAAPFVAAAPAAIWMATSADALYAGVAAASLCALVYATTTPRMPARLGLAAIGGV